MREANQSNSPPRPANTTHCSTSSFVSRLPVPRGWPRPALLSNKENEQHSSADTSTTTATKPLSAPTTRTQRQPLTTLRNPHSNNAAAHSTATDTATTADTPTTAQPVSLLSPPPPRAIRRHWVKSMDVLPAIIPALMQYSPSSAIGDSDGSTASDDSITTPERYDLRQSHLHTAAVVTPVDVKASTIAALQAHISEVQAQHAAAMAEKDADVQAVRDELQQCRVQLCAANAETRRVQQQLSDSATQVKELQSHLSESESKRRTAQSRLAEDRQREGEMRELRKQLAALRTELTIAKEGQVPPSDNASDVQSRASEVRLPVFVGDRIRRQRRVDIVG